MNIKLYDIISKNYNYLNEYGFQMEVNHIDEKCFGNEIIIFSSKYFLIRFVNDRNAYGIDVASSRDTAKWYDINFALELVSEETWDVFDLIEFSKVLPQYLKKIEHFFKTEYFVDGQMKLDDLVKKHSLGYSESLRKKVQLEENCHQRNLDDCLRSRLGLAWSAHNFKQVIYLIEAIKGKLTRSEIMKLEYAKKHLFDTK